MSSYSKRSKAKRRSAGAAKLGFKYSSAPRIKPGDHASYVGKHIKVDGKWFGLKGDKEEDLFACEILPHDPNYSGFVRQSVQHAFKIRLLDPQDDEEKEQTFFMNAECISFYFEQDRQQEGNSATADAAETTSTDLVVVPDASGTASTNQEQAVDARKQPRSVIYSYFTFIEEYKTSGNKPAFKWPCKNDDRDFSYINGVHSDSRWSMHTANLVNFVQCTKNERYWPTTWQEVKARYESRSALAKRKTGGQ